MVSTLLISKIVALIPWCGSAGSYLSISMISIHHLLRHGKSYQARKITLLYIATMLILATGWYISTIQITAWDIMSVAHNKPSRGVYTLAEICSMKLYIISDGVLVSQ
jgi:hypothetical protein